jgi:hypothetical protein
MVEALIKYYIFTIKCKWVFLPIDITQSYKDLPTFYSVMGTKQRSALSAVGIHSVELSRDEASRKVSKLFMMPLA